MITATTDRIPVGKLTTIFSKVNCKKTNDFGSHWLVLCLCCWLLAALSPGYGQSRLELIHSDASRGQLLKGESVRILEGNVHARQDTVDIFCDRATYFPEMKKLVLEGNVKLIRGVEILTARQVTYLNHRKMAIAEKAVHLERPDQEMFTDYLEYFYETDQAYAKHNVRLIDKASRAYVTAGEGEYIPQEHRYRVEQDSHFWQIDSSGQDTLHIYSRIMEYFFDRERTAIARDSVRIVRGDLYARCDSAVYFLDREQAFLEISPRAQQLNNEMTGDQMELAFQEMEIKRITVRGRALATSVEDSLNNKVNRLTGREIIAYIVDRKLDRLRAIDNARSLYYLKDEQGAQGVNTASADTIKVYLEEGEPRSISVIGGSQGIYYPEGYQGKIETEF